MLDTGFYFYDGTNYKKFAGQLQELKQYIQTPMQADELVVTVDAITPRPPFTEVVFVVDGTHIFHGVITKISDFGNSYDLTCKSMQYLLDYRVIPENIYHDVDIDTILSSDIPTTVMGVWFLVNAFIPNGKWVYHSSTVSKLLGGGLKSCFGALPLYSSTSYPNAGSIDACDGIATLADAGAVPTSANQYYRTVDDLYIRFGDGSYRENAYLVAAHRWADTRIRYGSCDIGTYKSPSSFSLVGQASQVLDDFAAKLGREVEFLPWHDGTLRYILGTEVPGRSSESNPVRTYRDGENDARIVINDQDIPDVQAAVSYSTKPDEIPQIVTEWSPGGVQLLKGYENPGAPKEDVLLSLQSIIGNNEDTAKVVTKNVDYYLRPGDWVGLYREDKGAFALRVKEKTITNGSMTLSLGKKIAAPSTVFGSYLRGEIVDMDMPRSITQLYESGESFTVSSENYALGGLKVYYEENLSILTGVAVSPISFLVLKINGDVTAPGRIKLSGSTTTLKLDITDWCTMPGTNTVDADLYATGWARGNRYVKQYLGVRFFAP